MNCINCCPPSIPSMVTHGEAKPKQYFNSVESFRPSSISKASWLLRWQNRGYGSFTPRATPASLFLAATSPPNSGDFSVIFQTSAVMLFMYWIANFVVPEFVMKDLQVDEANKDAKEEDRINEQGSTPTRTKEKGFGRTRE